MTEAELDYKKKLRSMDDILHQISRMDLAENKEGLSDTIPSLLKSIGNYTCADRVYLFEWATKEHLALSNTYEWCAPGIKPEIDNLQNIPISLMPSWMNTFWKQETVIIHDLEEIAGKYPQEYDFLKPQGIHSVIALPIYANHNLFGFIGLDNPDFSQDSLSIKLLSDVGGHLGSVLENMRMIQMLEKKQKRLQDALDAQVTQNEIISAISKIYRLIYLFDLTHDTFVELSNESRPEAWHAAPSGTGIAALFAVLKKAIVSPEFYEPVEAFIDISTLNERLKNTDYVSSEYKTLLGNWHLGRFIVKSRDADGNVTSVLYVVHEITDQKLLELEYRSKLLRSMEEARQANAAKTTFLNNMSHDIRTPMNAIIGFTNIAMKQNAPLQVKNYLEKIEESSEHLLALINDVLDISRIESGMIKYEPLPINILSITENVLNIMKGFLANRDLNFQLKKAEIENPYVLGDAVRIREILVNILSNAVKFTEDGGTITFETSYRPGNDPQQILIVYRISDTGIGMSEEFQKKLFDDFSQELSDARTKYKGTGLGMAITKRYVELMNGRIKVTSKKGAGSTFTVELPLQRADKEDAIEHEQTASPVNLHNVHILLAEDNDLNAEIATVQLEELGIQITRAFNGKEALRLFADNPVHTFDLILMDIMMPEMDGYTATKSIRTLSDRPDGKTIPIIAMTANAFTEDIQASIRAGMNDHIPKPIIMKQVVKVIAKNIRQ